MSRENPRLQSNNIIVKFILCFINPNGFFHSISIKEVSLQYWIKQNQVEEAKNQNQIGVYRRFAFEIHPCN